MLTQSVQYTAGQRTIGFNLLWKVFFVDRTDGKVARTDKQIKLATWKLVIENVFVCKGLNKPELIVIIDSDVEHLGINYYSMIYVCRKVLITRRAKHCKHKTIQILVVAGATLFNEGKHITAEGWKTCGPHSGGGQEPGKIGAGGGREAGGDGAGVMWGREAGEEWETLSFLMTF